MNRVWLVGKEPSLPGYHYVAEPPYDGAVIGSLNLGQALHFADQQTLEILAQGKPVILYTPGLPEVPKNRALSASLTAACRELKSWGVVFTDGAQKKLITAQQAKMMRQQRIQPPPGAVLTPLAKEILESEI